ncbi:MAG: SPFH domain-containing protein [Lachnospiraceae bacterium]|nr:SPFH domain-containing protein [Lachnospiraceae bacterium]
MGLISAALGAASGVLADSWKEFFYCEALPADVLVTKGKKRIGGRSSNRYGSDNIITSGSGIAVADGQCMIIVDNGKVVEVCAVPGEYTYDASTEASIFSGSLGQGIINTFKLIGKRITYGGEPAHDQRVYYFNTKEIMDNKFGTANPIPFRIVDHKIYLDIDSAVRCNGVYSYRIIDPILFYTNVCGNVSATFTRDQIDNQLRSEFISAMQPALGKISNLEVRPSALPSHTAELCDAMNEALTKEWAEKRGIAIVSIAINSITIPTEDQELIKKAQREAQQGMMYSNAAYAAGLNAAASAQAMQDAANNQGGAMMGFMGMNMAQQTGNANTAAMFQMAQQQQAMQQQAAPAAPAAEGWTCPSCGAVNQGKFCQECGAKKPAGAPLYKCDKCGWVPADPMNPPKFCPECGDPFTDDDIVK